jgi:hypothetical protein
MDNAIDRRAVLIGGSAMATGAVARLDRLEARLMPPAKPAVVVLIEGEPGGWATPHGEPEGACAPGTRVVRLGVREDGPQ